MREKVISSARKENVLLAIFPDPDEVLCPSGTLASWHRHYTIGQVQPACDPADYMRSLAEKADKDAADAVACTEKSGAARHPADIMADLIAVAEKGSVILPVYLHDHSGLILSTRPFHDPWDSEQIGFYHISSEDARNVFGLDAGTEDGRQKIKECLSEEIHDYSDLLSGKVYGFRLYVDGEETDSCWGFIGEIDGMIPRIRDYLPDELSELADNLSYGDREAEEYFETFGRKECV